MMMDAGGGRIVHDHQEVGSLSRVHDHVNQQHDKHFTQESCMTHTAGINIKEMFFMFVQPVDAMNAYLYQLPHLPYK